MSPSRDIVQIIRWPDEPSGQTVMEVIGSWCGPWQIKTQLKSPFDLLDGWRVDELHLSHILNTSSSLPCTLSWLCNLPVLSPVSSWNGLSDSLVQECRSDRLSTVARKDPSSLNTAKLMYICELPTVSVIELLLDIWISETCLSPTWSKSCNFESQVENTMDPEAGSSVTTSWKCVWSELVLRTRMTFENPTSICFVVGYFCARIPYIFGRIPWITQSTFIDVRERNRRALSLQATPTSVGIAGDW